MTASADAGAAQFPKHYRRRHLGLAVAASAMLALSGQRVGIDRALTMTGDAALASLRLGPTSPVADALARGLGQLWPLQVETREDVSRLTDFDPNNLPLFSHLETQRVPGADAGAGEAQATVLVDPLGYVSHVTLKMLETLEIALWGTLVAILLVLAGLATLLSDRRRRAGESVDR